MKRYGVCIVCLCCIILTLAAPLASGAAAPDYELSVLNAQTFPAGTTAYDASSAAATSAQPGEIVVLTLGFRNNAASAVEIGAFGAQLSYDRNALELYPLFGADAYQTGDAFSSDWMVSPNVKAANAYVSVAACASGDAATIAANSDAVIARFAFRVNSGAADGVTKFTFKAAKSYVGDGANKKLTLGDFAPFTLTLGGDNPAPTGDYELSVLNAQTFPAGTTAYDASAASATSAQPGEIVVLTLGFRNNAASAVEIGAFGAQLSYDKNALEAYNLFGGSAYQAGADFSKNWTVLGNAQENFVDIGGFANADAVTVASGGSAVIARFAFRVKSGAADGVTQFAFNAAKSYVSDGNGVELTLEDFAPFALTIDNKAPAYEYALDKLTIADGGISAEITNQSGAGGTLVIAAYAESGKFLRCAMETIAESRIARGSAENVTVKLDTSGAKTVRAFLLDADAAKSISQPRFIAVS